MSNRSSNSLRSPVTAIAKFVWSVFKTVSVYGILIPYAAYLALCILYLERPYYIWDFYDFRWAEGGAYNLIQRLRLALLLLFAPIVCLYYLWCLGRLFTKCSHGTFGFELYGCENCNQDERERTAKSSELAKRIAAENAQRVRDIESQNEERYHVWLQNYVEAKIQGDHEFFARFSSFEFEEFVASVLRLEGFEANVTPPSNDGGKDIIAWKNGIKYAVECKRYGKDNVVGRPLLQRLQGATIDSGAQEAIFVTAGDYSADARAYGEKHGIEL